MRLELTDGSKMEYGGEFCANISAAQSKGVGWGWGGGIKDTKDEG